jgi:small-conductance mechanosensitive channel
MIIAATLITGAFLLGLIVEKVIFTRLKKIAEASKWELDEKIVAALRGKGVLWFLLAGFHATLLNIQISPALVILIQKILLTIFLLSVTIVAAQIAVGFVRVYAKRSEGIFPSTSIFTNLTYILVFITGILIILQSLGISITPILTALGVGGLAVALALQDTLSNLFSGLHILASQQIKPGDYIKLSTGEEGHVLDITWRSTQQYDHCPQF